MHVWKEIILDIPFQWIKNVCMEGDRRCHAVNFLFKTLQRGYEKVDDRVFETLNLSHLTYAHVPKYTVHVC